MPNFIAHPSGDGAHESTAPADSTPVKKIEDPTPSNEVPTIKSRTPNTATAKLVLQLVHRFAIFLIAVAYVCISFGACYSATLLLRGHNNPWNGPSDDTLPLIGTFLGSETIRESPLVMGTLQNSTAPLNVSIYLQDFETVAIDMCTGIMPNTEKVFANVFMRSLFDAITTDTSYNATELEPSEIELIAPIVDCHATFLGYDGATSAKFFFLIRSRANHDDLSVLVVSLSIQQFHGADQNGAAAVATIQLVRDMRETDVDRRSHFIVSLGYPYRRLSFRKYEFLNLTEDGLATLRLVPPPGKRAVRKVIQTACREGFFIKGESVQSNIINYQWMIENEAVHVVSRWRWTSKSVLHDSWAWVHGLQFFIGMSLLSNLTILCLTTYRNFRNGHQWIGDAFVSISKTQVITVPAVLVSWYMNENWAAREFAYSTAMQLSGDTSVMVYDWHMRADILTLYLGACSLLGHALGERIDPVFAFICFLIGYDGRVTILTHVFPSIANEVIVYAYEVHSKCVSPRVPDQDKVSPMGFWTTHALDKPNITFAAQVVLPIYGTMIFVIIYAILRRLYRWKYPEKVHVQRNTSGTATSENERSLITQKRVLTLFEIATGAKLENHFGVLSDFETCVFVRGTKFASPDGIYSTGFVIANKKFLLQTSDYWTIVWMKVLGRRFRNVYVYDVQGSTVQQTARLVYPHTLSFADLMHIDVSRLT